MNVDPDVILAWPASKIARIHEFDSLYPPFDPWYAFSQLLAAVLNGDTRRKEYVKASDFYPRVLDEDEQAEEIMRYMTKGTSNNAISR